jgi:hypothetical protein
VERDRPGLEQCLQSALGELSEAALGVALGAMNFRRVDVQQAVALTRGVDRVAVNDDPPGGCRDGG